MGVVRLGGHTGSSSTNSNSPLASSNYQPSAPTRPQTFQQALDQARAASERAAGSKDPNLINAAAVNWAIVQDMEENDYRLAATSSEPAGQIAALDAKYGSLFRGHGRQTEFYDSTWHEAKTTVQQENPAERQYQINVYNAQTKVQETYKTLQSASTDAEKSAAYTAYAAAVRDQINLQLTHTLDAMPAGANGSHTLEQWKQAAEKVKQETGATDPDSAQVIDSIALVSGWLDQIQHNRGSLDLTPTEQALAEKDPVTLAFVKASGVTVNPDDPTLSPLMRDMAKRDPVMFTMLQVGKINVYTDNTPVLKDTPIGRLENGQYLHVTVNGTPLHDPNIINKLAQTYNQSDNEHRTAAIAAGLLPTLNIQGNPKLQSLMMAADNARMQWAPQAMKDRMAGGNPDMKGALSFLNTQLSGFFNPGDRAAFWESSGKPYFTQDYFRGQFKALMQRPDPNDENYYRDMNSTELNADKVGKYVQDLLKDAPSEVAGVVIDTIMSSFDKNWYHSNNIDMTGATSRFEDFYKGLSLAVELAPGRAKDVTTWLMDRDGVQNGVLPGLWDPNLRHFEGLKNTMEDGFGLLLSKTLNEAVQGSPDFQNMAWDMKLRYEQGDKKVQEEHFKTVGNQAYAEFMKNPDKVLKPFFESFLGDPLIGKPVDFKNDTQLRNMAGKALGLVPTNLEAASAKDYTQEWYKDGTAEWNKIQLVVEWIHEQGGATPNVTALPFKYASKRDGGLQSGALFLINKPGDAAPDVIDGTAALNAVDMNDGKDVNAHDVNVQWHYDDYRNFRDHNLYDTGGYIYLPTNMTLDADGDGKISSEDYYGEKAAIETGWEKTEKYGLFALTAIGAVTAIFVPPVGGAILAGTGILAGADGIYQLAKMSSHGASVSWDNPTARTYWLNISANLLAFGRLGILAGFGRTAGWGGVVVRGTAGTMGAGAGLIGVSQIAHQAGFILNSVGDPNVHWFDKVNAFAGLVSAAAMVRLAGARPNNNAAAAAAPRGRYVTVARVEPGLAATGEPALLATGPGSRPGGIAGEPGSRVTMSPGRAELAALAKDARSDRVITRAQLAVQQAFGKWIGTAPNKAPIRLDDAEFNPIASRLAPHESPENVMGIYDTKTGQIYLRNRGDNYLEAVSPVIAGHEYVHAVGSEFFYPATHNLVVKATGERLIEGITQYLTFKALGPKEYTEQVGGYGKYLEALYNGRNVESIWARTYTIETVIAERIFTRLGDTAYRAYFRGGFRDTEAFKAAALQDPLVGKVRGGSQSGLVARFNPVGTRAPIDKYGPTAMPGKPRQTTFVAFKDWVSSGARKVGLTSTIWSKAGEQSFRAWDEAGRPADTWWKGTGGAYTKYEPMINAKAQELHRNDPGTRLNWNDAKYMKPAEEMFAGQIGVEAYFGWLQAGKPRGINNSRPAYWTTSRAGRMFNEMIRGSAYRAWRAEQGFAADLGNAYKAHQTAVRAGVPEAPWWTQAKANLRGVIEAEAQAAFSRDTKKASGAKWSDQTYIKQGEEAVSLQLSVEAYRIWNEGIPSQGVPARQQPAVNGKRPWYTYQGWVRAGTPPRSTVGPGFLVRGANKLIHRTPPAVTDDVIFTASPVQIAVPFPKRMQGGANGLMPKKLTQDQVNRLGPWLDGRPTKPVYTPAKYNAISATGPWWKRSLTHGVNLGGRTVVAAKQAPGRIWRGSRLKAAQIVSGQGTALKQTPTDYMVWRGAESMFRARLGGKLYKEWIDLGRPVGREDGYFYTANTKIQTQIGEKALEYFKNPDKLAPGWRAKAPGWARNMPFLRTSVKDSVGYPHYEAMLKVPGEKDALIRSTAHDWKSLPVKTRSALPYWDKALADRTIQGLIQTGAKQLAGKKHAAGKTRIKPSHTRRAQDALADKIAQKAYELWKADNTPSVPRYGVEWREALAKETELTTTYGGRGFYGVWQAKDFPGGRRELPFTQARDNVMTENAYGNRYANFGRDAWHATGVYVRQMGVRATQRGGVFNNVSYRQHLWTVFHTIGSTMKGYSAIYLGTNVVGMLGWAVANEFTEAHRVTPMGKPEDELKAFLANPGSYVEDNYENHVLGFNVGDLGYQSDGHVMAFSGPDGMVYFQRVPIDLYNSLESIASTTATKPWLLDKTYQLNNPQVLKAPDGSIFVYQTVDTRGTTSPAEDINPFEADPNKLPDEIKEQIGLRSYLQWVQAGRPMTSPTALVWSQAETAFQANIGLAYNRWANTGRSADPYWSRAAEDFKTEVVNSDPTLKSGNYTQAQYNQVESRFAQQISMRAHQYWMGGNRDVNTKGSDVWRQYEPALQEAVTVPGYNAFAAQLAFQDKTGLAAYDQWVLAGKPETGANSYWKLAAEPFKGQGDEATHGADIAMQAYTYWTLDGRKSGTVGQEYWTAGETQLADMFGQTLLTSWQSQRTTVGQPAPPNRGPWVQNQGIWGEAVADWNKDGQPLMPLVQIRKPFKYEGNVDSDLPRSHVTGQNALGSGFRNRGAWAAGPIEGWRMHINWEATWNYRYNIPTATTFRVAGPSPTQGWDVDLRQQDTTIWSRLWLSVGSLEYNGTNVYDVTDKSQDGWSVMNTRLYADVGNRNRWQLDFTDKFLRARETGFVEIGVGPDFFKVWSGDQTFNVNGYFELQFYPGDLRLQTTHKPSNERYWRATTTMGFTKWPAPIGIDPAFQVTWTDSRLRLADYMQFSDIPFVNGEVR